MPQATAGRADANPRWSPDGRYVAFYRGSSWHVVRSDGRGLRSLGTGGFQWTRDGSRIVFQRGRTLYVATAEGSGARELARGDIFGFDVSPDGREVAYGDERIIAVSLADGRSRTITSAEPTSGYAPYDLSPQWAPHGRTLLFIREQSTDGVHGVSYLAVVGADGSSQRSLVDNSDGYEIAAQWSPDGKWVSFQEDYGGWVNLVAATGGDAEQIGIGDAVYWSPTSRWFAYERLATGTVQVARADGRAVVKLGRASFASWAPDGGALVLSRAGKLELVTPYGKLLRRLGPGNDAAFSRAGRLAFTIGCGERQGLWITDRTLAKPVRLTNECRIDGNGRSDGYPRIDGTAWRDVISGSDRHDVIYGHGGADVISGHDGPDALYGGDGNDLIVSTDQWRDLVVCGLGRDRVRADRADDVRGDCEHVVRR